ncbi:RlpA-like double-psi beta-barrel-protein domain-containing protein-containing protein [Xylariomycetidae sp. FL2044]|nr:RlpA-like double-psi beta-barrel-protein domain-containing protein-containing protein [Xylariomycetidae sp. FL2044]
MADGDQTPPVFQTPDWETPRPRPRPPSFLGRLMTSRDSFIGVGDGSAGTGVDAAATTADDGYAKETFEQSHTLPTHHMARSNTTGLEPGATKPTFSAAVRSRFDSLLPPYKTYFGRSRRFLLLYVLLPLAILLFVLLPLAVGLGVGLTTRHKGGSQNLPLPVSSSDVFTGDLTYYAPGLGACGVQSTAQDLICSIAHDVFDAASTGSDPNSNPLCGRKIRITRDFVEEGVGNRSVDVTVVDRCVGCAATDLDLSLEAFTQLASEASGRVEASWAWLV